MAEARGAAVLDAVPPGGGAPLDPMTRALMEPQFGHDFSRVHVHTDSWASDSAAALHAQAYTVGNDVVFRRGEYAPGTEEGRHLIAHELTHVVQQQASGTPVIQRMADDGDDDHAAPPADPATVADGDDVPLEDIVVQAQQEGPVAFGKSIHLQGQTRPFFRQSAQVARRHAVAASGCPACGPGQCVHVTGTLQMTFVCDATVTLPRVSDFPGLTQCEQRKVRDAINNVLAPHEQQHVGAFHTYNGTVQQPFDQTLCRSEIQPTMTAALNAVNGPRQAAAQAASDALDPFNFDFDLDCGDQAADNPPPAPSADGSAVASTDGSVPDTATV